MTNEEYAIDRVKFCLEQMEIAIVNDIRRLDMTAIILWRNLGENLARKIPNIAFQHSWGELTSCIDYGDRNSVSYDALLCRIQDCLESLLLPKELTNVTSDNIQN